MPTALGVSGTSLTGTAPIDPVNADPVGYNTVTNNGATILIVANTGMSSRTLSIPVVATVDGQPVNPRIYTIPAGQTIIAGPFPQWIYGTTMTLQASSSDVTLAALRSGSGYSLPSPFTFSAPAVVADLASAGLTLAGSVLVVDTGLTSSTVDGPVLVVTV